MNTVLLQDSFLDVYLVCGIRAIEMQISKIRAVVVAYAELKQSAAS